MKKKGFLLLSILFIMSVFLYGCTDKNGNDLSSMKLLKEANENFKNLTSYMKAEYKVNELGDKYVETKVKFSQFSLDEEGGIHTGSNNNFTIAYPEILKNYQDLKDKNETLTIDVHPLKNGKVKHEEYIRVEEEDGTYSEFLPYKNEEIDKAEVVINKDDMFNMLNAETSKNDPEGEVYLKAYTKGFFNLNVFPEALSNLKTIETKTIGNKEYTILKGNVTGDKKEMFLLYENAEVEFWIDNETKLVVREVYTDSNSEKKEVDTVAYEYSYFNEDILSNDFHNKKLEEKIDFYKNIFGK